MAKMNPVRLGSVPSEATKQGTLNETVGADVRDPAPPEKLDDGPKRGEVGEFQPAAYILPKSGNTRVDN